MSASVRNEVMASIIAWMAALPPDTDALTTARQHWPDVPVMVLAEAWAELEFSRVEAWWQSLEKTIDAEVIKAALLKVGAPS